MKASIEINLQSFKTPNYVLTSLIAQPAPKAPLMASPDVSSTTLPLRDDEIRNENPKYKLSELSEETLNKLCDKFRDDIFQKAGINRAHLITEKDERNT